MQDAPRRPAARPRPSGGAARAIALLAVQIACTAYFLADIGVDLVRYGLVRHNILELFVAAALVIGTGFGLREVMRALGRQRRIEAQLRAAGGALADLIEEHFDLWGLTPAERDVAMMAIKGLAIADIARLRGTAEGTVKAQSNAIYTKAGVSGRSQLLSIFIEELLAEPLQVRDMQAAK